MNRIKRMGALFFAFLMTAALLCQPVLADTAGKEHTIPELDSMTVVIPEGLYVFTPQLDPLDPNLAKAGITDPSALAKKFKDYEISLNAIGAGGNPNITIAKKTSATSQEVYDAAKLSQEEYQKFLEDMRSESGEADPNLISYGLTDYQGGTRPFFKVELKAKNTQPGKDGVLSEICYGTIINGYTVSIDAFVEGEMTAETEELLISIVDSAKFPNIVEKPAPVEQSTPQTILSLLLLASPIILIPALIIVYIVHSKRKAKKEKQSRSEMAERLSVYRKELDRKQKEATEAGVAYQEPETRFANVTQYSEKTIQKFVTFQCFFRNPVTPVVFFLLGIATILAGIFFDSSFLFRVIILACGVFMIVWPFLLPRRTKRELKRAYKGYRSQTALYYFRDEDFRITELQSPTLYPYFQIMEMYETKDYFYIYLNREQHYYVKKDSFKLGNSEDFSAFMKERLGNRYKKR